MYDIPSDLFTSTNHGPPRLNGDQSVRSFARDTPIAWRLRSNAPYNLIIMQNILAAILRF